MPSTAWTTAPLAMSPRSVGKCFTSLSTCRIGPPGRTGATSFDERTWLTPHLRPWRDRPSRLFRRLRQPARDQVLVGLVGERRHRRADVHHVWAPGGEPAPGRRVGEARHPPGDHLQRARYLLLASGGRPAALACTDAAASAKISATGATSTSCPAYITPTRSQICATTPRSCVISTIVVRSRVPQIPQQIEHLRLDRDVERGRRLVRQHERRARWPAPSRSRRAGACRRRGGAARRRTAAPARGCRPPQQLERAFASPARRSRRGARVIVSATCSPTGNVGSSDVMGSWKIMLIRSPRSLRSSSGGKAQQLEALGSGPTRRRERSPARAPSAPSRASSCRSPTRRRARRSRPRTTESDTSLTAETRPSSVANPTSTCSSASRSLTRSPPPGPGANVARRRRS